ncbi:hypothetical protein QML58_16485, partial [Providencia rettgeri]|nr:hypothetical protein [Providencia rettgeri]
TSWADSRLNSALKFRFFIKAPVLFWGEHITSVQVAKFIKPLQADNQEALAHPQSKRLGYWQSWYSMLGIKG